MAPSTREHYATLFAQLERECGPLSSTTRMPIMGFDSGGPVSIIQVGTGEHYVTCELSLYPEQHRSSEGLKFELFRAWICLGRHRRHSSPQWAPCRWRSS